MDGDEKIMPGLFGIDRMPGRYLWRFSFFNSSSGYLNDKK